MWLVGRSSFYLSTNSVSEDLSVRNASVVFPGIQKLKAEVAVSDYSVLIFWCSAHARCSCLHVRT